MVYADFEALVKPERERAEPGHNTFNYESQSPCSVGYFVLSVFPDFKRDYRSKTGEDCVRWFLTEMIELEQVAM